MELCADAVIKTVSQLQGTEIPKGLPVMASC